MKGLKSVSHGLRSWELLLVLKEIVHMPWSFPLLSFIRIPCGEEASLKAIWPNWVPHWEGPHTRAVVPGRACSRVQLA